MAVDPSTITNVTGLLSFPNNNTGGWFWFGVLLMVWMIMLLAELNFGIEIALVSSSFIMLMVSIFMFYAGLVSWTTGVIFFLAVFLGVIMYIFVTSWRVNA